MAIQLKVSNSLKSLAIELAEQIAQNKTVFRPVYLVTQTEGMNNWLKLQLAEQLGIAANIEFLKPNDILHKAYQLLGGTYSRSISSHDLNWLLYQALGEEKFIQNHPKIAAYYDFSLIQSDEKRMALAEKVADLFDQYQIYRSDMIENWNQDSDDSNWQKTLWLRTKELAGDHFPDKTMVGNFIIENVKDSSKIEKLQSEIPKVYFFGLSLISDYHLRIIHSLSQHIEIQFLIQNPAPTDYWFEEKSEKVIDLYKRKGYLDQDEFSHANPLLVGWGKLIQDTFMMLFKDENTLNNYQEIKSEEPGNQSLLNHIQNTIYNNQKEEIQFSEIQIQDRSLCVNACYNPLREVEVLYNYLVELVDQRKEKISARDIVVMVSDIDLYASYIRAVFDNSPYKFKYTIADETFSVSDSLSNSLIAILSLTASQFTSEKVVSLLDFQALRKNFQLTDVNQIRNWVNEANIRFGINGNREDSTDYVSWKYGLKRLMYGLCISGEPEVGEGETSFFPTDNVEGFEMFQVVRFTYFVELLIDQIQKRNRTRNIAEWVKYVEECIRLFIGEADEVEDEDYAFLLNELENYNLLQEIFTEEVSYEVFLHNFLPTLSQARRSHAFIGGGITFCSLVPMRSIPFKVVGLLGMNFDKFPRKDNRLSFDLMSNEKRKGDRNLKENDKHLFLETLLSAEKYLYISYIGQSVKDNSHLPPSAMVDELLDFIAVHSHDSAAFKKNFIQNHPLHGFSKRYNSGNEKLYSYLLNKNKKLISLIQDKEIQPIEIEEINISQLSSFFKNPIKTYFNRVFQVYFEDEDLSLRETEIFDLDQLQKWNIKNQLLHLESNEIETFKLKSIKKGNFPLKNMSDVKIIECQEDVEFVKENFQNLTDGFEEENLEIELLIEDVQITGIIGEIYNGNLVRYSFSKSDDKYKFEAWLHYLLAIASGKNVDLIYLSNTSEKVIKINQITNQEKAKEYLSLLVNLYKKGLNQMLCFDFGFYKKIKNPDKLDQSNWEKSMNDYFDDYHFPCSDLYHIKMNEIGFFKGKISYENFMEVHQDMYEPMISYFN